MYFNTPNTFDEYVKARIKFSRFCNYRGNIARPRQSGNVIKTSSTGKVKESADADKAVSDSVLAIVQELAAGPSTRTRTRVR